MFLFRYPDHLVSATLKESWRRETLKAILKAIQQAVEIVEEKEKDYFPEKPKKNRHKACLFIPDMLVGKYLHQEKPTVHLVVRHRRK